MVDSIHPVFSGQKDSDRELNSQGIIKKLYILKIRGKYLGMPHFSTSAGFHISPMLSTTGGHFATLTI